MGKEWEKRLLERFATLTKSLHRLNGVEVNPLLRGFRNTVHMEVWGDLWTWRWIHTEVYRGELGDDPATTPLWWPLEGTLRDLREMIEATKVVGGVAELIQARLQYRPQEPEATSQFREAINAREAATLAAWQWPDPHECPAWYDRGMSRLAQEFRAKAEPDWYLELESRLDPFRGDRVNPWQESFWHELDLPW